MKDKLGRKVKFGDTLTANSIEVSHLLSKLDLMFQDSDGVTWTQEQVNELFELFSEPSTSIYRFRLKAWDDGALPFVELEPLNVLVLDPKYQPIRFVLYDNKIDKFTLEIADEVMQMTELKQLKQRIEKLEEQQKVHESTIANARHSLQSQVTINWIIAIAFVAFALFSRS